MDLGTVTSYRHARTPEDLRLAPGEAFLAGGTWLFSEPQVRTTGLVDLTTLGWEPWERLPDGGLRIAATCTITELLAVPADALGRAHPLVRRCAEALLMSFKVQHEATVGGNVCLALPAGAMTTLATGLAGVAVVWSPDGTERREPVVDLVRGVRSTGLAAGEVLRAIELPAAALAQPTVLRRTTLAPLGRSSAVVVGRRTDRGLTLVVTAATTRPVVLDLPPHPTGADLASALDALDALDAVDGAGTWYADHHGPADWRAAVTRLLAADVCEALR